MRRILLALAVVVFSAARARAEAVIIPLADGTQLRAEEWKPEGTVVAPAIVALHGCGGPYPKRDRQWREILVGAGHIMLFPNSFSSRGLGSQCHVADRKVNSDDIRRSDAIASAQWLQAQPGTPAGGIVLMGWSDGGSTLMATATAAADIPPALFRGFVAFYPGCYVAVKNKAWQPLAPILLMIGLADDWTRAKPCKDVADRFQPQQLQFVGYPGAYHDFDVLGGIHVIGDIPHSQNPGHTVHAGTDPAAREDALKRVPEFLAALPAVGP
jgi:dienelactone hydrolase